MTRKDYVKIAEIFREHIKANTEAMDKAGTWSEELVAEVRANGYIKRILNDFMILLSWDNPNFDRGRFEEAVYRDIKKK